MRIEQDVWGPKCQLASELQHLRELTRGKRGPAGFMRIEAQLAKQITESQQSTRAHDATFETFNKATVQKILEGDGRKPSWPQVWSMATALRALTDGAATDATSDDALKDLWDSTAADMPSPISVHHDAERVFAWGRNQYESYRGRSAEKAQPLVEGVVALGSRMSRQRSARYDAVYYLDVQRDLTQLMEQPYLRDGAFETHTECAEAGFRVWGPIRKGASDGVTSFVGLDVVDRGVASVYFRWCLSSFPTQNRWGAKSPLHWGLMGARDLVLDAHRHLGIRGVVQAAVFSSDTAHMWPEGPRDRFNLYSSTGGLLGLRVSPLLELGVGDDSEMSWAGAYASLDRFLLRSLDPDA